jgi:hypothetical protein
MSAMRVVCPAHLILVAFITLYCLNELSSKLIYSGLRKIHRVVGKVYTSVAWFFPIHAYGCLLLSLLTHCIHRVPSLWLHCLPSVPLSIISDHWKKQWRSSSTFLRCCHWNKACREQTRREEQQKPTCTCCCHVTCTHLYLVCLLSNAFCAPFFTCQFTHNQWNQFGLRYSGLCRRVVM